MKGPTAAWQLYSIYTLEHLACNQETAKNFDMMHSSSVRCLPYCFADQGMPLHQKGVEGLENTLQHGKLGGNA